MRRPVLFSELFDEWSGEMDQWKQWALAPHSGLPVRRGSADQQRGSEQPAWAPPVDILESPDAVLLVVEVAGVPEADMHLELHDQILTVHGEKHLARRVEGENFHRAECLYGRFERSFSLGRAVDAENIRASYRDGLLRVRIPKAHREPRRIQVEVE